MMNGIGPTLNAAQPLPVNITAPGMLAWKDPGTWTANLAGGRPLEQAGHFAPAGVYFYHLVAGDFRE